MNELQIFTNKAFGSVRVVEQDGQPWFVASDVAKALGYFDPAQAVRDNCKKVNKITQQVSGTGSVKTPPVNILVIPESDVYRLIMRSNLPNAEKFQDWVVEEVLPSIRKHGLYAKEEVMDRILDDPDFGINLLQQYKVERQQRKLAEDQRNHAVLTKAEIGSRREATSMATASVATRKVNTLEDQLGDGKRFKMVKAIPWLFEMFINSKGMYSVVGKCLKRLSDDLGYQIKKIPCPDYPDGVNAYHVEVVDVFRRELQENPGILEKYRIFEGEGEAV